MSQVDSMRYFSYCENLFNLEMIQYEFEEVVFLICKKYIFTKKLQGEPKDYEVVIDEIKSLSSLQKEIKTGVFGADMQIDLINNDFDFIMISCDL